MTIILSDSDLDRSTAMQIAIETIEEAMAARSAGVLVSPPRHNVSFGGKGDLVFTIGGTIGEHSIAGFRVYETFKGLRHDQIVAVWSAETAELQGLVVGSRLGDIRTGAIGGIAIRHMSSPGVRTVGVIGSGHQARTQLEAAALVRRLDHVRVYSRHEQNRRTFSAEMEERLGIPVEPVDTPRRAVSEADIVICATTSRTPVMEAAWLKPGVHINTIGPKTVDEHELGLDIAAAAHLIATDSLEQTDAYKAPFFLHGSPDAVRLVDLAAIVSGRLRVRPAHDQTTLFCSAGLAGTEVLVASKLLAACGGKVPAA
ncbi:ornithine cyclodeaminase family protein [Rhizobium mongolense]|uniref:Ornithine cyclodeaminase n=2 Tax=Rhizobium mongolense TaxID=57676 RepID=A0ABR6IKN8_9HYPH|nr:ornithine cyclodeaminase family protein [Rhizobium mongolense]MBB4228124.1 ornithine cyclodeaminase [Rhizobium mongolense]TVZ64728.1 ornithine cyclodeaminase [Rhizobium mongolense USDA 1844]